MCEGRGVWLNVKAPAGVLLAALLNNSRALNRDGTHLTEGHLSSSQFWLKALVLLADGSVSIHPVILS